jgi:hypothetical protein
MRKAGLWLTIVPFVLAIVFIVRDVVATWRQFGGFDFNIGLFELLMLAVPGALLWLAGWIVDGLAEPEK